MALHAIIILLCVNAWHTIGSVTLMIYDNGVIISGKRVLLITLLSLIKLVNIIINTSKVRGIIARQ